MSCGFHRSGQVIDCSGKPKTHIRGADSVKIEATEGTGFVELALALDAAARGEELTESLPQAEIENQIRLSVEALAKNERLVVVTNVQHWLDEGGNPTGPLAYLLDVIKTLPAFGRHPVFLTSTRRPHLDALTARRIEVQFVNGLGDEHIAAVVRNWFFYIHGRELPAEDAKKLAPRLFGHPVAARLVAGLLGDHTADYLEKYPRELITLRRDLARLLLLDLKLSPSAEKLMEALALAGVGLPASAIAACGFTDEEFQQAVEQCTRAGLLTADTKIEGHPLFKEFFWHRLHRANYQELARQLAVALRIHITDIDKVSHEYVELLPVAFRLFALAGDLSTAGGASPRPLG